MSSDYSLKLRQKEFEESVQLPESAQEIFETFPSTLRAMLSTGEAVGENGKIKFVGGSTMNNLYVLHRLFNLTQAQRTLEVGLACGASALLLASLHKKRDRKGSGQHVAIDPFQHELDNAGVNQLRSEELSDYVRLYREPSHSALPSLFLAGERFDLIYIDGSHLYEDVFVDFFYGCRLLNEGGIVAFDDSTWPDVRKVLRFIKRNFPKVLEQIDVLSLRPSETVTVATRAAARIGRTQMTIFKRIGDPIRPWSASFVNF